MQLFSPLTRLVLSDSKAAAGTGDGTISDLVTRPFERRALSYCTSGPVGHMDAVTCGGDDISRLFMVVYDACRYVFCSEQEAVR